MQTPPPSYQEAIGARAQSPFTLESSSLPEWSSGSVLQRFGVTPLPRSLHRVLHETEFVYVLKALNDICRRFSCRDRPQLAPEWEKDRKKRLKKFSRFDADRARLIEKQLAPVKDALQTECQRIDSMFDFARRGVSMTAFVEERVGDASDTNHSSSSRLIKKVIVLRIDWNTYCDEPPVDGEAYSSGERCPQTYEDSGST